MSLFFPSHRKFRGHPFLIVMSIVMSTYVHLCVHMRMCVLGGGGDVGVSSLFSNIFFNMFN